MSTHVRPASPVDFLKKPFQEELQPICYFLDRPLYFRPERELAGSDFHRRKDRALQGTHNNVCERTIKTVIMGRTSWLFAGSRMAGERVARIMSLPETARRNGLEPHAWLTDVLNRLSSYRQDEMTGTSRYSLNPYAGNGSNLSRLSSGQPGRRFSTSVNNDAPRPFIFAVSSSPIIWAALSLATRVPAPALWPVRHGFLHGNPAILQEANP